jgi:hypothetical protein
VSTEILYNPLSPPQDQRYITRYLSDELDRISSAFNLLNTRLVTGVPWKAFSFYINGVNPPATANPLVSNSYNILSVTKVPATSGLYEATLLIPTVGGIQVLGRTYPFVEIIVAVKPVDTEVFFYSLISVNPATGVSRLQIYGGSVPASGKLTLVPYNLLPADRVAIMAVMNVGGEITGVSLPANAIMAQNLNTIGENP